MNANQSSTKVESKQKDVRFGFLIPMPLLKGAPVDSIFRTAERIEKADLDSLWISDHLLFFPWGMTPEAWSILSSIAMVTSSIKIGACVTDPHRRHPAIIAQLTATLDHISKGRAMLGIGPGESMNLDQFGIRWDKPVSRLEEAIRIIKLLWSGEPSTYDGKFYRLDDAILQIHPYSGMSCPIYVAANGPRSRELTGLLANGWIPINETTQLYRIHLKDVEEGAGKGGRSFEEIDTAIQIFTAVADEHDEALQALNVIKPVLGAWPSKLKEAGFDTRMLEAKYPLNYYTRGLLVKKEKEKEYDELGQFIPTEVVEELCIVGTVDECIGKIERFVKAGAKHFILFNMGPDPRKVLEVYSRQIAPYFR